MRLAIVGSRDYPCLDRVRELVRSLPSETVVVSGGARGVDATAVDEAKKCGLSTVVFPADWDRYGRSAGYKRNHKIVEACDEVVAFWDGKSKGTHHTIELAAEALKPVRIIAS